MANSSAGRTGHEANRHFDALLTHPPEGRMKQSDASVSTPEITEPNRLRKSKENLQDPCQSWFAAWNLDVDDA
jgi:hypothetical protein